MAWFDIDSLDYHPVEHPIDGTINVIFTDSTNEWSTKLVIGGEFDEIWSFSDSGLTIDSCGNILILNLLDDTWECLDNGLNGPVHTLELYDYASNRESIVIVGGEFDSSGTEYTGPISTWNNGAGYKTWSNFSPYLNSGAVYAVERITGTYSRNYYIGGSFDYFADSSLVNNIFSYNSIGFCNLLVMDWFAPVPTIF